jgi:peptidyl-prolyl cis-trans isomerase SurA
MPSAKSGLLLIVVFTALLSFNCNRASKTLVDIGDEKVTLGEFEKQFLKTLTSPDSAAAKTMDDKKQFLNLYINYRLKVKDARERGLLNNADMKKEIDEYKQTFSPNYLVDKEVVLPELDKIYERKKDEVRASHILITLGEKPTPQDSIAAYQKADSVIRRLKNGEDFGALAEIYSMDRTVKQNHGDLYYFTGGMTVPEFEDAVYNLKVGDYTKEPVRTMFGLHIVKLTDRKPRFESIRASHILLQDKRDSLGNIKDSLQTYQLALEISKNAKNGEDFASLVNQYSEDPGSKTNAGDLGYFDRRRMAQPLDSAVFLLKVGEIAGPIRTQYGWHIIKKTDEKPFQSFEKQKESIKTEYKRTKQYKDGYTKYVDKLKKNYNFKIAEDGIGMLKVKFDSTKSVADFKLDSIFTAQDKEKVLATYDGGTIKVSDFMTFTNENRDFQRTPLNDAILRTIISTSADNGILNKKSADLKIEKDDEYKDALTEYENGLLVFRVDQDELWSKIKLTDGDLNAFYSANKQRYTKTDSTGATVFKSFEEVKPELSNEMQQVKFKEIEKAYLDGLKAKYPVTIHEDVLEKAFKD